MRRSKEIALAVGEDPNNWCRVLTVSAVREGSGLTKTERVIYEEIARMRYLGDGFRILFGYREEATAANWKLITA